MKDRSKFGATMAPAFIAGCILTANAELARAEQPDETAPSVETAPAADTPTPPPLATAPIPVPAAAATQAASSWFARPPLQLVVGEEGRQFKLTVFGFAEIDYIYDTTRSYNDAIGSAVVARSDTLEGQNSRSQLSMRNSRLGFAFESPAMGSLRPSAVLEADFFGHQDNPPGSTESTYFNSPTFRVRHAYVKLQSPFVDVVIGQTYDLFGWQNYYFPCTVQYLGIPNQVFSRNAQLRVSHAFNAEGAVSVDVAASASRPAQRDSEVPDGNAGLRISLNDWKGITTPGNVGTTALPASVGVSGVFRHFKPNAATPPPSRNYKKLDGWGMSVDAFLPVIPATSDTDRGNRLTLTGSFVKGTGIANLINSGGNAHFPSLPNPQQATPPPEYDANVDNVGLLTFDANGDFHTINWISYKVGLQYYLPPTGRLIFSANLTESHSDNLSKLYQRGNSNIELLSMIADTSLYVDANLFWDMTPAMRIGISGQYTRVEYLDGNKPHNVRAMAQTVYQF